MIGITKSNAPLLPAPQSTQESKATGSSAIKQYHKRTIYARGLLFVLLETVFLIFAYYCLLHPIPLHLDSQDGLKVFLLNVTLTELKAGITAAFVVWHVIACVFIKDIIAIICSAEFMAYYRKHSRLTPGAADQVSTITSGIIDNLAHFCGSWASREFRVSFLVMLLVITIGPLGSGTVTIGSLTMSVDKHIAIARVTGAEGLYIIRDLEEQASLIMRLEQSSSTIYGYNMTPEDIIIPWPTLDMEILPDQSSLVYQSDILRLGYHCDWVINASLQTLLVSNPASSADVANERFEIRFHSSNGIFASNDLNRDDLLVGYEVIRMSSNGLSYPENVFLFLDSSNHQGYLNLSLAELPWTFDITMEGSVYTSTAAILSCIPSITMMSGPVTLSQNLLSFSPLPKASTVNKAVGNILLPAGYRLGSNLLYFAIEELGNNFPQRITRDLFLTSHRIYNIPNSFPITEFQPLPLEEINRNMVRYTRSAAKAYLNGAVYTSNETSTTHLAVNQTAQLISPVAALVTSKPFFILFTAVIFVVFILLLMLFWITRDVALSQFNLSHLLDILSKDVYTQ